jgi:hypothetical protein
VPPLDLPTLSWPEVGGVNTPEPLDVALTPNATGNAVATDVADWTSNVGVVATRWYTSTNWGIGSLNTEITTTTGISSPAEIAGALAGSITTPISYAKAVAIYMPNLWPLIFFLLLATAWIFFILIAKFGVAIISDVINFLFKLIEALPFVE